MSINQEILFHCDFGKVDACTGRAGRQAGYRHAQQKHRCERRLMSVYRKEERKKEEEGASSKSYESDQHDLCYLFFLFF